MNIEVIVSVSAFKLKNDFVRNMVGFVMDGHIYYRVGRL